MFSSKDLFFTPAAGGYTVSKSLRFRSGSTTYLNRTQGSPTNQIKWTWSAWVKLGTLGVDRTLFGAANAGSAPYASIFVTSGDNLRMNASLNGSTSDVDLITTSVYRDPSAWYHIVFIYDSAQGTSTNRCSLYVNGVQVTSFSTSTYPGSSVTTAINTNTYAAAFGRRQNGATWYFDGYLAEVNFVDGSALTPSSFGAYDTNGVWQPITPSVSSYGTNGFYLKFTDVGATSGSNTGYGKDFSTNTNYWTTNNFGTTSTATTYDSMLDSPTNAAGDIGNYCVLNPLDNYNNTVSDGNLTAILLGWPGGSNPNGNIAGSIAVTSGKYYWEVTVTAATSNGVGIGVARGADGITGYTSSGVYYLATGNSQTDGGTATAYGATYGVNDVIGVALDATGGTVTFYKQTGGTGSFTAYSALTLPSSSSGWKPKLGNTAGSGNSWTIVFNAGQRPLNNTIPSGYSPLTTQNLSTPTITNGAQYMAATTYTGNGTSITVSNSANNTIGTTFQPDFVWVKKRSAAGNNALFDVIRGVTKYLISDSTLAEGTDVQTLTSFNSTGFTYGNEASGNVNGATFVGWQWKANGTGVSNTSGSITSTVSANTSAGFSVVTYTGNGTIGATIGHGLGVKPSLIIAKTRSNADNWPVYHTSLGATKYIYLNTTGAEQTSSTTWNNTEPTSSVFTVYNDTRINASSYTYVAYCFAPVAGYSAFGSYTGNGSTDGPFVYTGFRPRWLLFKQSSAAGEYWHVMDTSRSPYNAVALDLYPNLSNAEATYTTPPFDFVSNGFKIRDSNTGWNTNGATYIYACFAENPFKISRAR